MKGFDSADIVEKETKRLEVIKRRQERELAQMVQYEVMRKELQANAQPFAVSVLHLIQKQ